MQVGQQDRPGFTKLKSGNLIKIIDAVMSSDLNAD